MIFHPKPVLFSLKNKKMNFKSVVWFIKAIIIIIIMILMTMI